MQTIKVKDLKPGMVIWRPGSVSLHKKTVVESPRFHLGSLATRLENGYVYLRLDEFIAIVDSKLLSML